MPTVAKSARGDLCGWHRPPVTTRSQLADLLKFGRSLYLPAPRDQKDGPHGTNAQSKPQISGQHGEQRHQDTPPRAAIRNGGLPATLQTRVVTATRMTPRRCSPGQPDRRAQVVRAR